MLAVKNSLFWPLSFEQRWKVCDARSHVQKHVCSEYACYVKGVCGGKRMRRTAVKKKKFKLLCKLETWTGSFVWHRMNADFLAVSLKVLGSNAPVSLWSFCMKCACFRCVCMGILHASSYSSKACMILNWMWVWMCRGSVICPGYTLPPTPWQLGEAPSSARISGSKWMGGCILFF